MFVLICFTLLSKMVMKIDRNNLRDTIKVMKTNYEYSKQFTPKTKSERLTLASDKARLAFTIYVYNRDRSNARKQLDKIEKLFQDSLYEVMYEADDAPMTIMNVGKCGSGIRGLMGTYKGDSRAIALGELFTKKLGHYNEYMRFMDN